MDFESVLRLGLGVCLLVALGASANALDGALTTDPSEVIDIDEETVPISEEDVGDLRAAVTGEPQESGDGQSRQEAATSDGDGEQEVARERGREADSDAGAAGPQQAAPSSRDGSQSQRAAAVDQSSESSQPSDEPPSLLERLLALLERIGPLVVGLAVIALLYALRSHRPTWGGADEAADDEADLVADPSDAISAAWYDMVRELGYGEDPSVTPRELVREAARTDVDPQVRTLTELYETTRYGGRPVTDERIRRARETLNEFRRERVDGSDG